MVQRSPIPTSTFDRSARALCIVVWIASALHAQEGTSKPPAIAVPDGFHVEHYADDDLAHDIHCLTIDSQGRIVVAGPGYVRILIDADNDGVADSFKTFSDAPKTGAQGMYFIGPHLLCSGDEGLQLYRDDNRDDKADGAPKTILKIRAGGEHHVHSIQRGADGWWYVIAGNNSDVDAGYATLPSSPIRKPYAGVLLRLKPDFSGGEIVADGFRNAYDFCFSQQGDVFTFDSDGERDVSLPWYQPCRVFHVTPRSNAGWVSRSWKRPNDFPDMPQVVAEFGRGSPTGVLCYRHTQFPSRYEGVVFVMDWTFGRIMAVPVLEDSNAIAAKPAVFAEGTGQFGFAPTDMAVSPDGSLFVSVGGRGTRGSVYRIFYKTSQPTSWPDEAGESESESLAFVLDAAQPNSSWSRASWLPVAKKLTAAPFAEAACDEGRRPEQRIRAIEVLTDVFGGLDEATVKRLTQAKSPKVRARAAWAIGRSPTESGYTESLMTLLSDTDSLVIRFALESLTTVTDEGLLDRALPHIAVSLSAEQRLVRSAASLTIGKLNARQQSELLRLIKDNAYAQVMMGLGQAERSDTFNYPAAKIAAELIASPKAEVAQKRDAARLLVMSLGDVGPQKGVTGMMESYTARADLKPHELQLNPVRIVLASTFPSGDELYDRELIRLISILGSLNGELIPKLMRQITADSHPAADMHRLAALSRIHAVRSSEQSVAAAAALVNLEVKIREQDLKQDSNWDDRIGELYEALCSVDPEVPRVIGRLPAFGLPGHVPFLKRIPPELTQQAIDSFARQVQADNGYQWSNDVVYVLGRSTNPHHKNLLRRQTDNLAILDAITEVLSKDPQQTDRAVFVSSLNSPQLSAVRASVRALVALQISNAAAEQFALLSAARRLNQNAEEYELREQTVRLLQRNMSKSFGFQFGKAGHQPRQEAIEKWHQFLKQRYPEFVSPGDGGKAAEELLASLDDVAWDDGAASRGERLFAKLSCNKCHGGRKALGPDLQGVAKRFSRRDLFAAIVDPNRDVSERYQTTTVVTKDGKIHSGLIAYQSVDGILLRDAAHNTYRIEAEQIETQIKKRTSLMPGGMLRNVSQQDLADLNAYLNSL